MAGEYSKRRYVFLVTAILLTLALFGYALGTPAFLDETPRIERARMDYGAALGGTLELKASDAAGYWVREKDIRQHLDASFGKRSTEVYAPLWPHFVESTLLGPLSLSLPLLRLLQLILHILTAYLLFNIAFRLSRSESVAWLAGLIFVLHPCHAFPVTTMAGSPVLWSAALALLSWELHNRSKDKGKLTWFALAAYILAVLSDYSALLLPFLFLWQDSRGIEGDQRLKRAALHIKHFLIAMLALGLLRLTWPMESGFYSIEWWWMMRPLASYSFWALNLLQSMFYFFAVIPPIPMLTVVTSWQIALALIISLGFFFLVPFFAWRYKSALVGNGFAAFVVFAVGLTGSISTPEVSYLPSIGMTLVVAGLLGRLLNASGMWRRLWRWAFLIVIVFYLPPSIYHIVQAQAIWRVGGETSQVLAQRLVKEYPNPDQDETIYVINSWPGAYFFANRVHGLYGRDDIKVRILTVDPNVSTDGTPLPEDLYAAKLSEFFLASRGVDELKAVFDKKAKLNAELDSSLFFLTLMEWGPQFRFSQLAKEESFRTDLFTVNSSGQGKYDMTNRLSFEFHDTEKAAEFLRLKDGDWSRMYSPHRLKAPSPKN